MAMGASLILCGVTVLYLSPYMKIAVIFGLFFVGGIGNGLHNVSVRNTIHHTFLEEQHGRAFSLYTAITRIGAMLGFFLGGLLGTHYVIHGYIISGILAFAIAAMAMLSVHRAEIVK